MDIEIIDNKAEEVLKPLTEEELLESDGGWCFILICGANFTPVFLPTLPGNGGESEIV